MNAAVMQPEFKIGTNEINPKTIVESLAKEPEKSRKARICFCISEIKFKKTLYFNILESRQTYLVALLFLIWRFSRFKRTENP